MGDSRGASDGVLAKKMHFPPTVGYYCLCNEVNVNVGISKRIVFGVVAALISAGVIAALVARYASQPWPAKPLETAFYVWQMQWNEGVREAVAHAAPSSAQFMVLLGEVNVAAATPTFAGCPG